MNPNQNQDNPLGNPELDGNPFEAILARIQSQKGQSMGGGMSQPPGQTPEGTHMMPNGQPMPNSQMPGMMGGQEKIPPNQLRTGEDSSSSPMLIGAVQALQKYITQEDDSNNIMTARSIIALISKLIERDQTEQAARLPQDEEALMAMQPPTGGQTPGGPSEVQPQA